MLFEVYDARGRLSGKTSTVSGQAYEVSRVHTAAGRLKHLVYPTGYTVEYARGVDGKVVSARRTFPNRATHTFLKDMTFKPFGGPAGFENGARGEVVNQSSDCGCLEVANPGSRFEKVFTYDDNGNITGISWTNIPSYNQTYAYDEVNRLTSAATYRGAFQYTYDKVGNRLTASQEGTPESYAYVPATNRLATVSAPDPVSITQDAAGNTTGIGAASLIYNQRHRMIRVEEGEATLGEYTYNALGQRVTKTVDGVTTVFHYDFDGNLIAESDANGVVAREYLYAIGTRMAMVDTPADALYYYHNDHLGTPLAMTDASGMIVWEAAYTPFGDARVSVRATIANPFRFPGQYYDAETGLHYNYHRYYDPQTGRYLRPDPIGLAGGINLFLYVQNNPASHIDPAGLAGIHVFFPDHPISIPGTNIQLPLGHAGVVAVDEKTGLTKYFEYGRYGDPNGLVQPRGVPNLVMKNGKPTAESLKNLYDSLSNRVGHGLPVYGVYYADADYQRIVDFALKAMKDSNRDPYSWFPIPGKYNTCYSFAEDAIEAGRVPWYERLFD